MRTLRRIASLPAALLLVSSLAAQSGGFAPGELILYSPAVQGSGSSDGAIVRIDPFTGQASILLDLLVTQSSTGSFAYDAFRDRLVFCGAFTVVNEPRRIWALDALGNTRDLGLGIRSLYAFAPASAGRIYYVDSNAITTAPLKYVDAADVEHTLLDSAGAAPFLGIPAVSFIRVMAYDAGTNALFAASVAASLSACSGGTSTALNVRKIPLSSDGARVDGAVTCVQFTVDPAGGVTPVGWSRAPSGQLLLVADTNSNAQQPRMMLVDPVTLAISAYASNGSYTGAAATNAGTYSTARGEVVVLDTFSNVLRAYSLGSAGNGTVITPSMQISSAGGSGEIATLIEIPAGDCGTNNVSVYCTAKTTSGGCVPAVSTVGGPSLSAPSGFTIRAMQVEPMKNGIFFYGLNGPAAAPFQGGFLCVQAPTKRTPVTSSGGGSAACDGVLAFDFNAWLASGGDAQVAGGSVVNGQFWFRDPAAASTTGLSDAVEFTVCD